jgi:death-on-curing protein
MKYLRLDEVLAIHSDQITRYGGLDGILDVGLLESALAMPQATFDGIDLHATVYEKAAAYLYHLVQNHAFVDGNKRAGLMAAIVFLGLNGMRVVADPDALGDLVLAVAAGQCSKSEVAVFMQNNILVKPAK